MWTHELLTINDMARNIFPIFIIIIAVAMPILGYFVLSAQIKKQLKPLLSIIDGRLYSKYRALS